MKGFAKKQSVVKEEKQDKPKKQRKGLSNGKKIAVICAMVVLLVVAAYLNVLLSQKTGTAKTQLQTDTGTATVSVFSAMKADRDTVRAQTYSYLDSIINSTTASAEAKSAAEDKKLSLIQYSSEEVVLENLIKARGFAEVCVTVTDQNVNVLVKDSDLTASEVAQILYVVTEETGCGATDVVVVPQS